MPANSQVLFVTLGSFNQLPEGVSEYSLRDSLLAQLPEHASSMLRESRQRAFAWLKGTKRTRWKGVLLPLLKYNQSLVAGYDLGGDDPHALYLPALRRFQGRFFQALELEGKRKLFLSKHHVLFLCGLYGLMSPTEPIQAYDCPIEPAWRLNDIWKEEGLLTQILLDYISHHRITRIFDFTAMSVRRNLIDWNKIRAASVDVLHAVGSMATNDDLLVPLGHLWRHELLDAPEGDLLAIQLGSSKRTPTQEIWFHAKPGPHGKGPREVERDEWVEKLERMQYGVIRFLDKVEGGCGKRGEMTGKRVERLYTEGKLGRKHANAMHAILGLRNPVRYEEHKPKPHEIREIEKAWNELLNKVENEGWDLPAFGGLR